PNSTARPSGSMNIVASSAIPANTTIASAKRTPLQRHSRGNSLSMPVLLVRLPYVYRDFARMIGELPRVVVHPLEKSAAHRRGGRGLRQLNHRDSSYGKYAARFIRCPAAHLRQQ